VASPQALSLTNFQNAALKNDSSHFAQKMDCIPWDGARAIVKGPNEFCGICVVILRLFVFNFRLHIILLFAVH